MERHKVYHVLFGIVLGILLTGSTWAQNPGKSPYAFSADVFTVSKYVWRGQRLTDGWSLQPAGTLEIGNLSFSAWGNLDLQAVNEGDALFLPENPAAPAGDHNGLQGRFSEVDYTFAYAIPLEKVSFDVGTIVYTFPERSASLATTVEVYGGVTLETLPFAPSATLYVDVDESNAGGGSTGLYFLMAGSHQIPFGHARFPGLELAASLSAVNGGFGEFYYGDSQGGLHDASLTIQLPVNLGERWSAGAFVSYSALLGDFRAHQFQNPRHLYLGTAGSPASYADTVWGGINLSLSF